MVYYLVQSYFCIGPFRIAFLKMIESPLKPPVDDPDIKMLLLDWEDQFHSPL